jgi:hypothetical protein
VVTGPRRFEPDVEAIGAIRSFVRDTLVRHGCDDDDIDAAILCASEVATTALLHGDGTAIDVDIDLAEGARVTVRDTGPEPAGARLLIVNTFADAWGSVPAAGGTAVWFEIDLREKDDRRPPEAERRRRSDLPGRG